MTNEEKARELIGCDWCESINKCNYKETGINCYAYGIAMKMAEWKDKKFDAILLCIKNSFEKQNIKGADEFIAEMKKHWEM